MTQASLIALAALVGWAATWCVWRVVTSREIHVIPNERSMHARPIAIGAGWAIVGAVLVCWPLAATTAATQMLMLLAGMLILAAVGWRDDLEPLPPLLRLVLQAAIIAACLASLPASALTLGGILPLWLDRFLTGLGWLWFVNLYNFMDGIDGLTGVETVAIAGGYVLLATWDGPPASLDTLAAVLAGAAAGFLVFNWHPARIILGDVGSVPLGFLLGWLMLDLAMRGYIAAAVILPMYHLADATYTLLARVMTVPEPWRPHRQHFYQRAVLGGLNVPQVARRIAALDVVLIGLAALSMTRPWVATICAGGATLGLLVHFEGKARAKPPRCAEGSASSSQTSTSHHTAA